jgi:hypothetical protein
MIGFINFLINYIFPFIKSRKGFKRYNPENFKKPNSISSILFYFINVFAKGFSEVVFKLEHKFNPCANIPRIEQKWYTEDLKPIQVNIFMGTVLGDLMKRMINPDGTVEIYEDIIVSQRDKNYILDGHHRWAASMLVSPNQKVIQGFPMYDYSFLYFMWEYIKQPIYKKIRKYEMKYFKIISVETPDGIIELNCVGNDLPIDKANIKQFLDCLYTGKYMDPGVYKYDKEKAKKLIDYVGGENILLERFLKIKKELKNVKQYRRIMLKYNLKKLFKMV